MTTGGARRAPRRVRPGELGPEPRRRRSLSGGARRRPWRSRDAVGDGEGSPRLPRRRRDRHRRIRAAGLKRKSLGWEAIYSSRRRELWAASRGRAGACERAGRAFERPDFRPRRVLELGCGDGVNAVFMAARGSAVTAVDVSATALEMAREKQKEAAVEVDWVESDVFELGPPPSPTTSSSIVACCITCRSSGSRTTRPWWRIAWRPAATST